MNSPLFSKTSSQAQGPPRPSSLMASRLGTRFDPYDTSVMPKRVITIGSAANFPSIVAMIGDIFNSSVFVPSATPSPSIMLNRPDASPGGTLMSPLTSGPSPAPSRLSAALGGAYVARWSWRRQTRPEENYPSFEDEIRDLLQKKWQQNAASQKLTVSTPSLTVPGSGPNSAYPQLAKRSALANASTLIEEPEDEELAPNNLNEASREASTPTLVGLGLGLGSFLNAGGGITISKEDGGSFITRARTPTTSSTQSSALTSLSIGTGITSPSSIGTSAYSPSPNSAIPVTISVTPLHTDDKDGQAGLLMVSEADHDSFMTYAAIVPEYCRLEGMLIKNLV